MKKLFLALILCASLSAFEYGSKGGFPALNKDSGLVFLNNAATTQKPREVIDSLVDYYENYNGCLSRGNVVVCKNPMASYENSRIVVADFINASSEEIVFVRGATEGINFIAHSWAHNIEKDDEIVISALEHNANYLPWKNLCEVKGAKLHVIPLKDGHVDIGAYKNMITSKTKLIAISKISNATGTYLPVKEIIAFAKEKDIPVLVDVSQAIPYEKIDVKIMNPDFLVFSGHKMFSPEGIGVVYIKAERREELTPYMYGGGMDINLFEAGTPSAADAYGLQTAIKFYQDNIDYSKLQKHLARLCSRLIDGLEQIEGVTIYGDKEELKSKGHLVSFSAGDKDPFAIGRYLRMLGFVVRVGTHCSDLSRESFGYNDTIRVSFHCYNNAEDVDRLVNLLKRVCNV